jgi:AAA ATPase domain
MAAPPSLLSFFDHNPPPPTLASQLFVNREREMKGALRRLRGEPTSDLILAVHGPRRVGKSHFVREFLSRLSAQDGAWRIVTINASSRGEVRNVLEELYFELWLAVQRLDPKVAAEDRRSFDELLATLERERPLVFGEFAERVHEVGRTRSEGAAAGIEVRAGAATAKLGGTAEEREQETERVTVRVLSDREVVERIRALLDALKQFEPARPVLIFVDDLDLLDRRGREGAEVSATLIDRLASLADHPAALVLVTMRELGFSGRDKDFNDFVRLDYLSGDALRAVYARHIEVFNEGKIVFSEEVLTSLLEGADGRVGIFLRTCRELWSYFVPDPGEVIDAARLREFLAARLAHFRRDETTMHIVPIVERALEDRVAQVQIPSGLEDSPLLFSMLFPVPGQPDRFTIAPAWRDVFERTRRAPTA